MDFSLYFQPILRHTFHTLARPRAWETRAGEGPPQEQEPENGNFRVLAWGRNNQGQSTVTKGLSDVKAVSAGLRHTLAPKKKGEKDMMILPAIFVLMFIALGIVLVLRFYRTLCRALRLAGMHSLMRPKLVYLNLIPLFGQIWFFYTVICVSEAVRRRLSEMGLEPRDGGYGFGLALGILSVISPALYSLQYRDGVTGIQENISLLSVSLITLALWIVYWATIAKYNRMMGRETNG